MPANAPQQSGNPADYVSPSVIHPLPKAGQRKTVTRRKKGTTKVLTDTPVRN